MLRLCYAAMQLCGGGKRAKRIVDPLIGMSFAGRSATSFAQKIMAVADATSLQR